MLGKRGGKRKSRWNEDEEVEKVIEGFQRATMASSKGPEKKFFEPPQLPRNYQPKSAIKASRFDVRRTVLFFSINRLISCLLCAGAPRGESEDDQPHPFPEAAGPADGGREEKDQGRRSKREDQERRATQGVPREGGDGRGQEEAQLLRTFRKVRF